MTHSPVLPTENLAFQQSLKGRGAPKKVNLCTTKFVEECKTLTPTTVAVPIPLPEELVHFAQKGDAEMPSGKERKGEGAACMFQKDLGREESSSNNGVANVLKPVAGTRERQDRGQLGRGGARMESDWSTRDFRLL